MKRHAFTATIPMLATVIVLVVLVALSAMAVLSITAKGKAGINSTETLSSEGTLTQCAQFCGDKYITEPPDVQAQAKCNKVECHGGSIEYHVDAGADYNKACMDSPDIPADCKANCPVILTSTDCKTVLNQTSRPKDTYDLINVSSCTNCNMSAALQTCNNMLGNPLWTSIVAPKTQERCLKDKQIKAICNDEGTFAATCIIGLSNGASCTCDPCWPWISCGYGDCLVSSGGGCVPVPDPSQKKVFVSSAKYNGNLVGLSGADAKCQALADAACLAGTFKAWLSDSATSAASRLTHAAVPYKRVDGVTVANNWADLTDGSLQNPINKHENGNPISMPGVADAYTGTDNAGGFVSNDCNDWTSTSNLVLGAAGRFNTLTMWSYWVSGSCGGYLPIYCFEQ